MADAVPLLDVKDLTVEFSTRRGIVRAVEHVSFYYVAERPER